MLKNLPQEKVQLRILKSEVGNINDSDAKLADMSGAQIVGFRVKVTPEVMKLLKKDEQKKVRIKTFDIIYELIQEVRNSMEIVGRVAAQHLERYLSLLGTLASAAPLLGLLGTVVGMIEIFGAHQANTNQPAQLAHGISVALYNTAFGLVIAIPALLFWRYFRARVDRHLLAMEVAADRFAHHLAKLRR